VLRAAELFFRPQRLTVHDGSLLAADQEYIDASGAAASPLASMLGLPEQFDVDVLSDANASGYWERSDRFDLALDLTAERRGLVTLGTVIGKWIEHLLALEVTVEPLTEAADVNLVWYVGLDAAATAIGDALWNDDELDPA